MSCGKKQRERHNGTPVTRCIHQESEFHLQVIQDSDCSGCPFSGRLPKDAGWPPCMFRANGDYCGQTHLTVTEEICRSCSKISPDAEKAKNVVVNYARAMTRWIAAGRPTRSEEEVKRLFEEHCNRCALYDRDKKACNSCGCRVSGDQVLAAVNKIKMGTESCPLGRW